MISRKPPCQYVLIATLVTLSFLFGGCSKADRPELVRQPVGMGSTEPDPESEIDGPEISLETQEETRDGNGLKLDEITDVTRGISESVISIGVIKSGNVFQDIEIGVEALFQRVNGEGGIDSRTIEVVEVIDDEGEEKLALAAAKKLANEDLFAVILASTGAGSEVTDFLADNEIPFFGWGFSEGFCEPNKWGFGFNGCLNSVSTSSLTSIQDTSSLRLTSIFYGRTPKIVLVTTDDDAGFAVAAQTEAVWGQNLIQTIKIEEGVTSSEIIVQLEGVDADVLWLSVGLEETISLKRQLIDQFPGMVLDDVTYLPGILQEYEISRQLEGGYVFSQFPPQEEYRAATTRIMTDLEKVNGPLIYSQAISIGYWSADLLVSILNAVDSEITLRTFFRTANVEGILYESDISGGPCPIETTLIHQDPAGGAALLQVRGGVFRPVVNFNCPLED